MPTNYTLEERLAYLRALANDDAAEQEWTRTLREYHSGEQPTYITDRQEEFIGLKAKDADHLYAHNLCRLVVDSVVERLSLTGFADGEVAENDAAVSAFSQAVMGWWADNRMDASQDELYEAACRDGEAYLVVDWGGEFPRWTINYKFDGTQGIKIHRNPNTNSIDFASKTWQTYDPLHPDKTGLMRQTLYFPDRVEKYIQSRSASAKFAAVNMDTITDEPDEPWPIPWVDKDGKPLGVAVIPFENPGGSEIAQMIGPQDMLNKSDLDMIASEDMSGFRIMYATGVPVKIDKTTGENEKITIAPGRLLQMADPAAKLVALDPVDPNLMIQASKYWIETIAGITRTPQYLFQAQGAEQPSGESLKMQEIGLVNKVFRKQHVFGNAWEDCAYLSANLWNLYIPGQQLNIVNLQAQWESPISKNEAEEIAAAIQKKQLGIPDERIWAELGYSPEEIGEFKKLNAEARAELEAEQKTTLAQMMLKAQRDFDQGKGA